METINRRSIMMNAWKIVRTANLTIAQALKKVWGSYHLRQLLKVSKTRFKFVKADGSIRKAFGTLNNEYFSYERKGGAEKFGSMSYWDLEKNSFRSFKIENLVTTV